MKDLRRKLSWKTNIQARIRELRCSGDVQQAWRGHQLELALIAYVKSVEMIRGCLGVLDVAAQEGSHLPPPKPQLWSKGRGKYLALSNYAKEIVRKAERRALLRLDDSSGRRPSSDQIYFDVIAALARDKQVAKCPPWSKIPGRNFAVTLMGLCRADLVTVPPRPDLSFYLEYLEEKLGVYHHEHIVLKKKLSKSKKSRS
jgi:hypothetical protein